MKTIKLSNGEIRNGYEFADLSKEAKETVINYFSESAGEEKWYQYVFEDAKEIGLEIKEFGFDSASFVRNVSGEFLLSANEVAQNIFNNHGESCDTYKTAESFMEKWQPVFNDYMQTEEGESHLIDIENDFLNDLLNDYKTMLQDEYNHITSKEAAIETIECNKYLFDEDGEILPLLYHVGENNKVTKITYGKKEIEATII